MSAMWGKEQDKKDWECVWGWVAILNKMSRGELIIDRVAFEQSHRRGNSLSQNSPFFEILGPGLFSEFFKI